MLDWHRCLGVGGTLAYEVRFRNHVFVRSWGELVAIDDATGQLQFRFLQEVDPTVFGRGGARTRLAASLLCDGQARPATYDQIVGGGRTRIVFAGDQFTATLFDGSTIAGTTGNADFVLGGNLIPQLAVKARVLYEQRPQPYDGAFFATDALHAVPYRIWWDSGAARTSFGERLEVDAHGWITGMRLEDPAFHIVRVDTPVPKWRSLVAGLPLARYTPPPDSVCRLVEADFDHDGIRVGATLALPPAHAPPRAAALFLGGSGRYDRHGLAGTLDLGYHELLDRLAEHGLCSLRFDRRGAGTTALGSHPVEPRFADVVGDARAAWQALQHRREVRGLPLVLIGHSEGGLVALELASDATALRGLALLATAARPIDQILEEQLRGFSREIQRTEAELAQAIDEHRAFFRALRDVPDWRPDTVPPKVYGRRHARRWYAELLERDPLALVRRVRAPTLILQGDADRQVSIDDARLLFEAARGAGVDATLVILERHDHLLKREGRTPGIRAYFDRRRRISRTVVRQLVSWLNGLLAEDRPPQ